MTCSRRWLVGARVRLVTRVDDGPLQRRLEDRPRPRRSRSAASDSEPRLSPRRWSGRSPTRPAPAITCRLTKNGIRPANDLGERRGPRHQVVLVGAVRRALVVGGAFVQVHRYSKVPVSGRCAPDGGLKHDGLACLVPLERRRMPVTSGLEYSGCVWSTYSRAPLVSTMLASGRVLVLANSPPAAAGMSVSWLGLPRPGPARRRARRAAGPRPRSPTGPARPGCPGAPRSVHDLPGHQHGVGGGPPGRGDAVLGLDPHHPARRHARRLRGGPAAPGRAGRGGRGQAARGRRGRPRGRRGRRGRPGAAPGGRGAAGARGGGGRGCRAGAAAGPGEIAVMRTPEAPRPRITAISTTPGRPVPTARPAGPTTRPKRGVPARHAGSARTGQAGQDRSARRGRRACTGCPGSTSVPAPSSPPSHAAAHRTATARGRARPGGGPPRGAPPPSPTAGSPAPRPRRRGRRRRRRTCTRPVRRARRRTRCGGPGRPSGPAGRRPRAGRRGPRETSHHPTTRSSAGAATPVRWSRTHHPRTGTRSTSWRAHRSSTIARATSCSPASTASRSRVTRPYASSGGPPAPHRSPTRARLPAARPGVAGVWRLPEGRRVRRGRSGPRRR